jgi:hypothetical protein
MQKGRRSRIVVRALKITGQGQVVKGNEWKEAKAYGSTLIFQGMDIVRCVSDAER